MLSDHILPQLLAQNRDWAAAVERSNPEFFPESAQDQTPQVLWIGCSDSRVPESVITASMPGTIFAHRNIANQCRLNDDNFLSVLEYAVGTLMVEHIIIVGHTTCGGVLYAWKIAHGKDPYEDSASCGDHIPRMLSSETPLSRWIQPLTELARTHLELDAAELGRRNVQAQVRDVVQSMPVQQAWADRNVQVHGWEYNLATGSLRDLDVTVDRETSGATSDAA